MPGKADFTEDESELVAGLARGGWSLDGREGRHVPRVVGARQRRTLRLARSTARASRSTHSWPRSSQTKRYVAAEVRRDQGRSDALTDGRRALERRRRPTRSSSYEKSCSHGGSESPRPSGGSSDVSEAERAAIEDASSLYPSGSE